jgi:hypothetical protein
MRLTAIEVAIVDVIPEQDLDSKPLEGQIYSLVRGFSAVDRHCSASTEHRGSERATKTFLSTEIPEFSLFSIPTPHIKHQHPSHLMNSLSRRCRMPPD